jgi:ribosomal protein L37E
MMNEKMEDRLQQIIDPEAYGSDTAYHMMVTLFRQWLNQVEWACKDEDIPDQKTAAILNRLTYGHPYGADALLRMEMDTTRLEEIKRNPLQTVFVCSRCGRVSHNAHDIKEGYCGACHDWTAQERSS